MTPAPCWRCGEPGVRDVGTRGYCREHYIEIDPLEQPAMCVINGTLRTDNECTRRRVNVPGAGQNAWRF